MLRKFVITYIDNILIYSPNEDLHITHVKEVLSRLLRRQLYVKAEKCEFHIHQVTFFGYVSSAAGVMMDKKKVKELQRFLDFFGFCKLLLMFHSRIQHHRSTITNPPEGNP